MIQIKIMGMAELDADADFDYSSVELTDRLEKSIETVKCGSISILYNLSYIFSLHLKITALTA